MARTRTLAMIKPDAREHTRMIERIIEAHDFIIISQKTIQLSREQAIEFCSAHAQQKFFGDAIRHMTSGPVTVMVLEHDELDAVTLWRTIMGATDPDKADRDTIRRIFWNRTGMIYDENSVHGSDGPEAAAAEIKRFFPKLLA